MKLRFPQINPPKRIETFEPEVQVSPVQPIRRVMGGDPIDSQIHP